MYDQINKPWGYFHVLNSQEGFLVKKIFVKPLSKLSLQSHKHRSEHWVTVLGIASVIIDENSYKISVNESIYVPLGSKHRLENNTEKDLIIVEVQIGDNLKEDDIVRYDDMYDREVLL